MRILLLTFLLIGPSAWAQVPCKTNLATPVWTQINTRVALLKLGKAGYSLDAKTLKNLKEPQAIEIITNSLGFHTRPRLLLEQTTKLHGSLQNALWSKERIKDALIALNKNRHRPNAQFFKYTNATPDILKIIEDAIGFKTNLYSVFSQARSLFGTFKKALEYAGLDDLFHSKGSQWTKQATHKALQVLYKNGYRPKPYYLTREADYEAQALMEKALGFSVSLGMLYMKAREFHGGDFRQALIEAKLPADDILTIDPRTPWDQDAVYRGLRALYRAGYSPNATFLQKSKDALALAYVERAVGFKTKLSTLYNKAVEFHKMGFQQAVFKARLPVRDIVRRLSTNGFDKDLIKLGLTTLYDAGIDPNPNIFKQRDAEIEELLEKALGFPVTTSMFYDQTLIFYQSNFQAALTDADLPAEELMQRWNTDLLTPASILRGLRALFSSGYFPTTTLVDNLDPKIAEILKHSLGFPVRKGTFFRYASLYYQNRLSNARVKAGILEKRLAQVIAQSEIRTSKEDIIYSLKALYAVGAYYNTATIKSNNRKVKVALKEIFDEPVAIGYLFDQSELVFGSYRKALLAAELPADEIIAYRNTNLTNISVIRRATENNNTVVVDSAPSPEDDMLKLDVQYALLSILPEELKDTGRIILDEILSSDELDYENCLERLQNEGESPDRIRRVFSLWRGHKDLWSYLNEF